jgi:hypothetical protein
MRGTPALLDTRSHKSTGSMEVPVIPSSDGDADCPWSPREAELLAVTLELLQEHGYDRLTLDAWPRRHTPASPRFTAGGRPRPNW